MPLYSTKETIDAVLALLRGETDTKIANVQQGVGALRTDVAQNLNAGQQAVARANLGIPLILFYPSGTSQATIEAALTTSPPPDKTVVLVDQP